MSEILSSLHENWGLPGQVNSIRALISLIERWSEDVNNEELLESMSLSIEHFVCEKLETASFLTEGLPPQASDCLAELTAQFEILTSYLEELDEALEARNVSEVLSVASRIRDAAQEVGATQASLEEWMRNPEPCCLCCGGTEDCQGMCPKCEIELMVPNLTPAFASVNVQLEPEFYAIYERYVAIGRGDATLSSILALLPPAEEHLKELAQAAKNVIRRAEDAPTREGMLRATQTVERSFGQIRAATQSKRKVDLDQAWQNTANGLIQVAQALNQLLEKLGVEVESDDGGDQISLD